MAPFFPAFRELTPAPDVLRTFEGISRLPYPLLLDSATILDNPDSPAAFRAGANLSNFDGHGNPLASFQTTATARYSFAMASPRYVIRAKGREVEEIDCQTRTVVRGRGRALDIARTYLERVSPYPSQMIAGLPPFLGGIAGYIGYEYSGVLERIPPAPRDDLALPDVVLGVYPWVIAWDHAAQRAWVIGEESTEVDRIVALVAESSENALPAPAPLHHARELGDLLSLRSTFTQAEYTRAIERIQEYIRAGDIFQVNLSQRFTAPFSSESAWELYRRLRARNPAPFAAYFDFGDATIVSASPERFLRTDADGHVETRPIKGTRPRALDEAQDTSNSTELIQSDKDRAEHVMIVDVLRNDISRVCEYGSVDVPELFTHERHPTVHHLVSTITGRLRSDATAIDLMHSCFPGGSITGAPKVRAMEIIAELEPTTRGPYCGTLAYLSTTGAMDSSILIRTFVITPNHAHFSAGGGIVADSLPDAEYTETFDKARALIEVVS